MRNEQIKKIAFTGIIIALIIVMSFTMLGFITISSGASITLVHIPMKPFESMKKELLHFSSPSIHTFVASPP